MDVREKLSSKKRLIDANKLIKNGIRVSYGFDNDGVLLIPMGDVIRSIKNAPTINDVEVVRCLDCKHLMFSDCYGECDMGYMGVVRPDDFCSRGERKEGADNG